MLRLQYYFNYLSYFKTALQVLKVSKKQEIKFPPSSDENDAKAEIVLPDALFESQGIMFFYFIWVLFNQFALVLYQSVKTHQAVIY